MRRAVTLAGLLALLAGAAIWWVPYLTRERDYAASVVQPQPLTGPALVVLRASQRACFGPVTMTVASTQARFRVGTYFRPRGPRMELTIAGPGYLVRRPIAAGFPDNTAFRIGLPAPARDLPVRVCIANRGSRRVALHAASDRTKLPFVTRVDGQPQPANPAFAFYEARPVTIVERLPRIIDRMSLFKPGPIGPWLLWPLLFVVVLGVPLTALWALGRAVGEEPEAVGRHDDAAVEQPERPVSAPVA